MNVDVVVNPVHAEALHALTRVQGLCASAGAAARVRMTSIARPHGGADAGADLTVVIGGDGTLREVAGRLTAARVWRGALLPVPTGTASLFALNAGIASTAQGLRVLAQWLTDSSRTTREGMTARDTPAGQGWTTLHADLGLARVGRMDGRWSPPLAFLVSAGIGNSGATILRTPARAKRLLGAAGYGVGALRPLHAPSPSLRVGPDAATCIWTVEWGLVSRIPFGITVFPHGGLDSGDLAGLLVRFPGEADQPAGARTEASEDGAPAAGTGSGPGGVRVGSDDAGTPTARLIRRLPGWGRITRAGLCGGHMEVPELQLWRTTEARVRADRAVPAHVDGESVGLVMGLAVSCSPARLPIIVPSRGLADPRP